MGGQAVGLDALHLTVSDYFNQGSQQPALKKSPYLFHAAFS